MRSRECTAILLLIGALACGCATAPTAPEDWLPEASEVPTNVYGGWIEVDYDSSSNELELDGELLAIENHNVYVRRGPDVRAVPIDSVRQARVTIYDANTGAAVGAIFLGTLLTVSNGVALLITAPMWIVIGSATAGKDTHDATAGIPRRAWADLIPYARFPQGLPPGFVPRPQPGPAEAVASEVPPEPTPELEPKPPAARDNAEWGFAAGMGRAEFADQVGLGLLLDVSLGKRWASAGVRFTAATREGGEVPYNPEFPEASYSGEVFDLGLVLGVRGAYKALHVALRAGPAAWGLSIGELADLQPSLAVQGELFLARWRSFGIGTIVAYNANELQDYYVVAVAIAIGPR